MPRIKRPIIGGTEYYRGHAIEALHVGPDLVATVDGDEIPNFFTDSESARKKAREFVDELEKEKRG